MKTRTKVGVAGGAIAAVGLATGILLRGGGEESRALPSSGGQEKVVEEASTKTFPPTFSTPFVEVLRESGLGEKREWAGLQRAPMFTERKETVRATFEDVMPIRMPGGLSGGEKEALREKRVPFLKYRQGCKALRELVGKERGRENPPPFYTAVGVYDGMQKCLDFPGRDVWVVKLFPGWEGRLRQQERMRDGICILDMPIGEYALNEIRAFMEKVGPKEVVLSWDEVNNLETPSELEDFLPDLKGAIEAIKRVDSTTFIWITLSFGPGMDEWASLINPLPFDGVLLWNVHTLPVGWDKDFLKHPLLWCQENLDNRPVAIALYGRKVWKVTDLETAERVKGDLREMKGRVEETAQDVGYAALWWMVGRIPDAKYPAAIY